MDGAHANPAAEAGHHGSGPVVWASIITATCLLLFFFQKILWLVVPFLFGLIIYYLLFPLQQRLVLGGMTRDAASALVSAAVFALAALVAFFTFPWLGSHLASWQDSGTRYIEGGLRFVANARASRDHIKATGLILHGRLIERELARHHAAKVILRHEAQLDVDIGKAQIAVEQQRALATTRERMG